MKVWIFSMAYDGEDVNLYATKELAVAAIRAYVQENRDYRGRDTLAALDAEPFDVDALIEAFNDDEEHNSHGASIGLEEREIIGSTDPAPALRDALEQLVVVFDRVGGPLAVEPAIAVARDLIAPEVNA